MPSGARRHRRSASSPATLALLVMSDTGRRGMAVRRLRLDCFGRRSGARSTVCWTPAIKSQLEAGSRSTGSNGKPRAHLVAGSELSLVESGGRGHRSPRPPDSTGSRSRRTSLAAPPADWRDRRPPKAPHRLGLDGQRKRRVRGRRGKGCSCHRTQVSRDGRRDRSPVLRTYSRACSMRVVMSS